MDVQARMEIKKTEAGLFTQFTNSLSANAPAKDYGHYVQEIIKIAQECFGSKAHVSKQGSANQGTYLTSSDLGLLLEGVTLTKDKRRFFRSRLEKSTVFEGAFFGTGKNAVKIKNPDIDICFANTWLLKRYPGGDFFNSKPDAQRAVRALKYWNKTSHKKKVDGYVFSSLVRTYYSEDSGDPSGMVILVKVMQFLAFAEDEDRKENLGDFDDAVVSPLKVHAENMVRQFGNRPDEGFINEEDLRDWLQENYQPPKGTQKCHVSAFNVGLTTEVVHAVSHDPEIEALFKELKIDTKYLQNVAEHEIKKSDLVNLSREDMHLLFDGKLGPSSRLYAEIQKQSRLQESEEKEDSTPLLVKTLLENMQTKRDETRWTWAGGIEDFYEIVKKYSVSDWQYGVVLHGTMRIVSQIEDTKLFIEGYIFLNYGRSEVKSKFMCTLERSSHSRRWEVCYHSVNKTFQMFNPTKCVDAESLGIQVYVRKH